MTDGLTLFTILKSFDDPHIATIQRNALRSWQQTYPACEILVFGDKAGAVEICTELGLTHVPGLRHGATGWDLLSDAFERAWEVAQYDTLCFANADIILPPTFAQTVRAIDAEHFLMIGERFETPLTGLLDFKSGWWAAVQAFARANGGSGGVPSMDYFVHRRGAFAPLPEIYCGTWYSDNYFVADALRRGYPVIDASAVVMALHQIHDHSHYPGDLPALAVGTESTANYALLPEGQVYNLAHATVKLLPGD